METKNDRVRQVRNYLKLSQAAFGKAIGISQRQVAHIELGGNIIERNSESICRVFNVNPQWLETGEGEMFKPPPEKDFLDLLAEEKGLNSEEKALIGSIVELPRPAREAVIDWAFKLVATIEAQTSEEQKETQIRELEKSIAEQQKQLEKLKGGVAPYVEDLSIETG